MKLVRFTAIFSLVVSILLAGSLRHPQGVRAWTRNVAQPEGSPSTLFGATSGDDTNLPSDFYSIDPLTGVPTLIGPVGFKAVSAMDFNPFTGVLYATGRRSTDGTFVLMTINELTGLGTEIGPLGPGSNVQDMSFRNADAKLFGYRDSRLVSINITTGAATEIGPFVGHTNGNAIAFSPSDTLFQSNDNLLFTLDQTTGAKTLATTLQYPPGLSNPRLAAMDFLPGTSTLYGVVVTTGGGGRHVATINTVSGAVTLIGQVLIRLDALAWSPSVPSGGFDLCLQDESNGNLLRVNSGTGEYQLNNCQGFSMGGFGVISTRGCFLTLQVNGPDRRVLARIDTCMKSGTAFLQILATGQAFSVFDRNMTNNTCACPAD